MALFKPYKITSDQLSSLSKAEGQLIVVSDTNEMYIDVSNSSRIRIGENLYTKLAGIAEGATKVEASSTNGKIKINGTDTTVYTHPSTTAVTAAAVKVGKDVSGHVVLGDALGKSDVGLGNVGNFKAVSTVASQGLTDTEKSNARANIGAGTSSLTLGDTATTAAAGNHTHSLSMATDTGTSSITLAHGGKYKLTAGGSTYVFTMPSDNNTTYTFATGDNNGQIAVTPSGGSKQNVSVKGLAALAYKDSLTASEVGAIATTAKGAASGVAELDANGKVPTSQLPAYVDDVVEGYYYNNKWYSDSSHTTEIAGETGKIYVDLSTNKTYRYSGTAFVEISSSLALGETSSTAYRGDRGKTAYDHSQSTHARTDATKTESSSTNGNIKINGTETTVYTHPAYTAATAAAKKVGLDATGHVVLGAALTASDVGASASDHTHTLTIDSDSGTSAIDLAANTKYKITAGGSTFIFKTPTDTNTKNTAGSTDSSSKLFIIGATSQAANPQTYSHDTAYVGTDGHLYSNSTQVVNLSDTQALTNKTYNGYTLAAACAKAVDSSITISSSSTNLPTSAAVAGMVSSALTWNTI